MEEGSTDAIVVGLTEEQNKKVAEKIRKEKELEEGTYKIGVFGEDGGQMLYSFSSKNIDTTLDNLLVRSNGFSNCEEKLFAKNTKVLFWSGDNNQTKTVFDGTLEEFWKRFGYCKVQIFDKKDGDVLFESIGRTPGLANPRLYKHPMKEEYWIKILKIKDSKEELIHSRLAKDMWAIGCPGNCGGECFEHPDWIEYRKKVKADPQLKQEMFTRITQNAGVGATNIPKVLQSDARMMELLNEYALETGKKGLNGSYQIDMQGFQEYVRQKYLLRKEKTGGGSERTTVMLGQLGDQKMSLGDYEAYEKHSKSGGNDIVFKYIKKYKDEIDGLGKDKGYLWINMSEESDLPHTGVYTQFEVKKNTVVWEDKKFLTYIQQYQQTEFGFPVYLYKHKRNIWAAVVGLPWKIIK